MSRRFAHVFTLTWESSFNSGIVEKLRDEKIAEMISSQHHRFVHEAIRTDLSFYQSEMLEYVEK